MSTDDRAVTRRTVLRTAGAAAVVGGLSLAGTAGAEGGAWEVVDTPTSKPLYDVVHTGNGPYAVGEGGLLLDRTNDGWEVALSDGPGGENNTLHAAAETNDGGRVWMTGASGAVGAYDVESGRTYNHVQPAGIQEPLGAVTVDGGRGGEELVVGSDAGQTVAGSEQDGDFAWDEALRPTAPRSAASRPTRTTHSIPSRRSSAPTREGTRSGCTSSATPRRRSGSRRPRSRSTTSSPIATGCSSRAIRAPSTSTTRRSPSGPPSTWPTGPCGRSPVRPSSDGSSASATVGWSTSGRTTTSGPLVADADADLSGAAYLDHPFGTLIAPVDVAVGDDGVVLERDAEF